MGRSSRPPCHEQLWSRSPTSTADRTDRQHIVIRQYHATALDHDFRLGRRTRRARCRSGRYPGLAQKGERHRRSGPPTTSWTHATFSGVHTWARDAGEVRILDHGDYETGGRTDDRITFRLDGERLAGIWASASTGLKDGKEQWLALMSKVLRPPDQERPPLEPMLATQTAEAFDDPEWEFEPKWDGIRALAVCEEGTRLHLTKEPRHHGCLSRTAQNPRTSGGNRRGTRR